MSHLEVLKDLIRETEKGIANYRKKHGICARGMVFHLAELDQEYKQAMDAEWERVVTKAREAMRRKAAMDAVKAQIQEKNNDSL